MKNDTGLSQRQLELQVCLSQRRIDKINAILKSGVQAPIDDTVDAETTEVITRLYDTSLSDADIACGIDILEMLLEREGLNALLNLMKSAGYSMDLRQRAAKTISVIGSNYVENDLRALLVSPLPELRKLAGIAFGKGDRG